METLMLVAKHKNRYYNENKENFGSPPLKSINCRSYESGAGLLPTPVKTNIIKHAINSKTEEPKNSKRWVSKTNGMTHSNEEKVFNGGFCFSELWAGPAYSNSPPPSSLPMPKFFLKPKRTVSLELHRSVDDDIDLDPISKSAPASPTRALSLSPRDFFNDDADFATKTLRRILNLDITDE